MINKTKLLSIIQGVLIALVILGALSFLTGIYAIRYNSFVGWTVFRHEGWARIIPLVFVLLSFYWFTLNRKRHIMGFWIGATIGYLSIAWNFILIFPAWQSGESLVYSAWYAITQLVRVAVITFILWKVWFPLRILYSDRLHDENSGGLERQSSK